MEFITVILSLPLAMTKTTPLGPNATRSPTATITSAVVALKSPAPTHARRAAETSRSSRSGRVGSSLPHDADPIALFSFLQSSPRQSSIPSPTGESFPIHLRITSDPLLSALAVTHRDVRRLGCGFSNILRPHYPHSIRESQWHTACELIQ